MKKLSTIYLLAAVVLMSMNFTSCKKKMKDADIKASIETALKADPMAAGLTVDVNEGVATLSGQCSDENCKTHCGELVKDIKGVKSVVNNSTIAPPIVPPVENLDALTQAVKDAVKDYPGVKTDLKDGVLSLTGEVGKDKLQQLMMALSALKSMGVKQIISSSLVKK